MRIPLALWLALMTLASGVCAFVALGALVMTPMMFTSSKVVKDPNAWLFIGAIASSLVVLLALMVLQWVLYAQKKNRGSFIVSLHPLLAYGIYITYISPPVDFSGRDHTLNSKETWATHVVRFRVHAPDLQPQEELFVYTHYPMDTTGKYGTPLRFVGEGDWELNTVLPKTQYLYMFNLGDWKHQALQPDGQPRHNTSFQLDSDTTLFDTIPGWLSQPPPDRHVVQMQVTTYAHDTLSVIREVIPRHEENTEEAP